MAIFYLGAGLGDVFHALGAEFVEFGVRAALVVALLVSGGIQALVVGYHVVLQLAHGVEVHAGLFVESLASFEQGILGRSLEGMSVLVEEGCEHRQGGNLGKGVYEGCAVTGNYIEVGVAGFDEGEQAGTIHALAESKDRLKIFLRVNHEVKRLKTLVDFKVLN